MIINVRVGSLFLHCLRKHNRILILSLLTCSCTSSVCQWLGHHHILFGKAGYTVGNGSNCWCGPAVIHDQTTTPGTTSPTLCEQWVGSLTSHRVIYEQGLWDGTSGLSSLSKKTLGKKLALPYMYVSLPRYKKWELVKWELVNCQNEIT